MTSGTATGSATGSGTAPGSALDAYLASFAEPVGYLNFGSYGPPSRSLRDLVQASGFAATG